MTKLYARAALFAFSYVCLAGTVLGQDWPQWRGPNRNNVIPGFTVPAQWPGELKPVWKEKVGRGDSSPALVGDRLFMFAREGDEEIMMALDAATGKSIWQERQPAPEVGGGARQHPGPRSTPAVADGKVYAVGVAGVLSCWDAGTGTVVWRKDAQDIADSTLMFFASSSPLVTDGKCIAHLGNEERGALVAYDAVSGEERWRWGDEGASYGSPVLMTVGGVKQVVTEAAKSLVGVALDDGRLLWKIPFQGRRLQPTGTPLVIEDDTIVYTLSGTHAAKITKDGNEFKTEELWSTPSPAPRYASPVLKDGFLYSGTSTGNVTCMNAKTGEYAWIDTTRRGDPITVLDVGAVLLVFGANSEMAVIEPNPEKCVVITTYKVADSAVWCYPVLSGKRIFVKDLDSLALLLVE